TGLVVHRDSITAAMAVRGGRPIVLLDVALPRDVDPDVRDVPGVTLVDLEAIAEASVGAEDVDAGRAIVAEEGLAYRGLQMRAQRSWLLLSRRCGRRPPRWSQPNSVGSMGESLS